MWRRGGECSNILSHLRNASFAVDIYFIISGFLLYKSFNKEPHVLVLSFIKKRLLRLFPLYFFSLSLVYFFNFEYFSTKISHVNDFIYQIFMLQSTGLKVSGYLLNPYAWYVCVLFWCSIFLYLLFKVTNKYSLYIILFTISFTFYSILSMKGIGNAHREIYYNLVSGGLLRAMAGLSLGAILANYKPIYIKNNYLFYLLCIIENLLFIILFTKIYFYHKENYILLLIYFIVMFLLSIIINYNLSIKHNNNVLSYLNSIKFKDKYGYAIYLFQWPVFLALHKINIFDSHFFINNLYLCIFLIVIIVSVVGVFATYIVNFIVSRFILKS